MISKECFTSQWIEDISAKLEYNDKNLIEKVIRALSLLEMLVQSGCPLTFKGLCIATHKPLTITTPTLHTLDGCSLAVSKSIAAKSIIVRSSYTLPRSLPLLRP